MHLFNKIKFSTPESVELEFTLAGIGSRAWALII
ncbi:MAG: RDD family protein, partial [Sphaerospermopsis kisseleviana]